MQEAMKRPDMQAQVQQMSAAMQNQQLQERMATLKVHLPGNPYKTLQHLALWQ